MIRKPLQTVTGINTSDGAGVKLVRVIGHRNVYDFDPFLMLDAFDSNDPKDYIKGFPWHPHRGIETVTYLITGDIQHGDSLGNEGRILDGCCQWMTAGSGIMHQEMPQPSEKMLGVQLWVNLPAKNKMTSPKYHDIEAKDVPLIKKDDYEVRVISGSFDNIKSKDNDEFVKTTFLDVLLKPDKPFEIETAPDSTLFLYIVYGDGYFADLDELFSSKRAVLFDKGEIFHAKAGKEGIRFLLFNAKPLKEPISWGGPIVMNTKEELQKAFDDLSNGTFIKKN
ncbi:MAG: pirin family protein [Clostridia bacterium]|nr:pirin family protein [Clostridia bacterium]